jgi:hypothetical protein
MSFGPELTTADVLAGFTDAVAARGGSVTDAFDDGDRLFARGTFPRLDTVRPNDGFRGGVALRAAGGRVSVYPYLFRLVCSNGAVMAQTLAARHLTDLFDRTPDEAAEVLHEAVAACGADEAFAAALGHVRAAVDSEIDLALTLMPMLARLPRSAAPHLLSQIMRHLFRDGRRTRYDLMNAVTATARDTDDPALRWDLEELGGAIAVGGTAAPPRRPTATAAARHLEAVAVEC